jgi:Papain-like cysteine protease AvrRpt2
MVYDIPGLRFQQQQDPHWCWAAVSWMVMDFYSKGQGLSQCQIGSRLSGGQCCPAPSGSPTDPCSTLASLEDALTLVGHSAGPLVEPPQPFTLVTGEIMAQRPICAQMALSGVNHYVVLSACADDGGIRVLDPSAGFYNTDFNTFTRFDPTNHRGYCTGWLLTR